jgi:hypothetical protein
MSAPWWWLRVRAASPLELAWRLLPPRPVRPCPDGPSPRWPWPVPALPPLDEALLAPEPGRWQARWLDDPKPVWHRQRPYARDLDRWWAVHRPEGPSTLLWASTHAVACRVPALALSGHREALWAHAEHLATRPSRFSSANNHRVAELCALAVAGATLPDAPWSVAELPAVLAAQLHPDGWPREQSVAYLAHVLEWGVLAHRLGAPGLAEPLRAGLRALCAVLADDGSAPTLGDDGGDEVLPSDPVDPPYALSVAGAVAVALGQAPPASWRADLRSTLLGLTDPGHRAPRTGSCSFVDGGLTVLASPRWRVLFDHGPVGMEPLAAHGHADALATWAHLDGRPLWGGRGTSSYHAPRRRELERGVLGASTVAVGGRGSSVPHDHPFLWDQRHDAQLLHLRLAPGGGEVAGAVRGLWGGVHRRHLHLEHDRLVLREQLDGSGLHHVALRFHLAPGRAADELRWEGPAGLERREEVQRHAVAYGEQVDAVTVCFEGVVRLPVELVTGVEPARAG